jgi:hypothetical protein
MRLGASLLIATSDSKWVRLPASGWSSAILCAAPYPFSQALSSVLPLLTTSIAYYLQWLSPSPLSAKPLLSIVHRVLLHQQPDNAY